MSGWDVAKNLFHRIVDDVVHSATTNAFAGCGPAPVFDDLPAQQCSYAVYEKRVVNVANASNEPALVTVLAAPADSSCVETQLRELAKSGKPTQQMPSQICGVPADIGWIAPGQSAPMLLSRDHAGVTWDNYDKNNTSTRQGVVVDLRGGTLSQTPVSVHVSSVEEIHGNIRRLPTGHVGCLYSPGMTKANNPEPQEIASHPGPGAPLVTLE